ncbi:unnamed protein product [Amaranthus hypochondriacus]
MSSANFLMATALLQKAGTLCSIRNNSAMSTMVGGFDELGTLSSQVGSTTNMAQILPPQLSSSLNANTTTETTTTTITNHQSSDQLSIMLATWRKNNDGLTRDFLGLTAGDYNTNVSDEMDRNMLKFTGELQYQMTAAYDHNNSSSSSILLKPEQQQHDLVHHHHDHQEVDGFGFVAAEPPTAAASVSRWG